MTTIRPATAGDRAAILTMATHFAEQTDYGKLFGIQADAIGPLLDVILAAGPHGAAVVFVAVDDADDVPFGMIAVMIVGQAFTAAHYVDELVWWVEKTHRRTRGGLLLLEAAIVWTRTHGLSVLKMVAPAQFKRLGEFYERRGFVPIETAYTLRV